MKKNLIILVLVSASLAFVCGCASSHDHGVYLPENTMVNGVENVAGFVLLSGVPNTQSRARASRRPCCQTGECR